jgi:hydrophobic/amphiphilic exporter-1 (mainly G- bacteria), HAE1 family
MTTIAALVGFLPLVVATGAGAGSRVSLRTAVFGRLLISAILSLLLVPVLYVVIKNLEDAVQGKNPKPPQSLGTPPSPPSGPSSELATANGHGNGREYTRFQP